MNDDKNIIFSAADIERYHKKQLSAKEMHALEKAALDDPFLADALEGYSAVETDVRNDIGLLREQLNKRVASETKVIPLKIVGIPWLRVAALVIVIAGAGILAYQFVFNKQNEAVAKSEPAAESKTAPAVADKNTVSIIKEQQNDSAQLTDSITNSTAINKNEEAESGNAVAGVKQKGKRQPRQDSIGDSKEYATELTKAAPGIKTESQAATAPAVDLSEQAKKADDNKRNQNEPALNEVVLSKAKAIQKQAPNRSYSSAFARPNVFRGQITDENNTPLPFANVTNTKDGVGTYTDVKGNFTLVSPDSMLDIQVRSVGFENATSQLQNNVSANAIVLQQDTSKTPATVLSNKQFNTDRTKRGTLTVEEPEPYDGWYNYDTYIANNITIPEERRRQNATVTEVELSFDISKNGEPINIKVEKSACTACDAEAIRLLKEGPKWKPKKRNKRAKLNVAF